MSLLLWLYVASISDPTRPQTSTIHPNLPVSVRNVAQNLVIVGELPSVEVQVRNAGGNGDASPPNSPEAFVDLQGLGPGKTLVPVQVENHGDRGTVNVRPSQITVHLEEAQRASFPVVTRILSADSQGIDRADLRLSTDRATVRGAPRNVNRVAEVRASVDLATLSPGVPQPIALNAVDRGGKPVDGITIEPVEVTVSVAPSATSTPPP